MVERFEIGNDVDPEIYKHTEGRYVLYSDYARLREALRECVEAISDLGEIVGEVEDACNNWHDHGHRGSRMGMFRIAHAVENPKAGVAIVKAVVVERKAREVLGDE